MSNEGYTEWDLKGNRRAHIGADCIRKFRSSGEHQYRMAGARIAELEATLSEIAKLPRFSPCENKDAPVKMVRSDNGVFIQHFSVQAIINKGE